MRALPLLLLLCACGGGGGGGGDPPPPVAPAPGAVSGLSPFPPSCGGTGGTSYVNSEVEPHLAVNPRDANHLLAAWQQDRWSNGAARGLLAATSLDGGTTWTISQAPFAECNGGTAANGGGFQRATDPWVAFAADGTAYQMGLAISGASFTESSESAMTVSRSADGGRTWSNPVSLIYDFGPDFFNDKNTITADPLDARFVYAVWDRLRRAANGPTYFARTLDGGATWEPARNIYNPGPRSQTIGNVIRVLPDGTLVNLFTQLDGTDTSIPTGSLRVIRSGDRGATWSAPTIVSSHQPIGTRDEQTGRRVRDGSILAQMAAGRDGSLHVVWQDARFSGARDAIAYSRSVDGGLTWTAPVRVNGNSNAAAFMPQVHVLADGTIGVAYYDLRSDTPDVATLPADYWLARSTDGVAWTETRVAGPFDLLLAPDAGGLFLGDYMGLEGAGTTFLSLHVRTTGNAANRTDVYFSRVPASAPGIAYTASGPKAALRDATFERRVAENFARAAAARGVRTPQP